MGAGKSMLYSCLLDHRSRLAPSNRCSETEMRALGISKSVADAKLCVQRAETYQVKKSQIVRNARKTQKKSVYFEISQFSLQRLIVVQ